MHIAKFMNAQCKVFAYFVYCLAQFLTERYFFGSAKEGFGVNLLVTGNEYQERVSSLQPSNEALSLPATLNRQNCLVDYS